MGSYTKFTLEQEHWLCDNIHNCNSYSHLAEMFNATFGTNRTGGQISDKCCKRMHINRDANTGLFSTGAKPQYPIGAEIVKNDGYVWIKINDAYHPGKTSMQEYSENWIPKHRYIYQQTHSDMNPTDIVVFLDGDRRNFDISNLYAVPRSIHSTMCRNGWYTTSRDNTLAAIKYCQLFCTIRAAKHESL